MLTTWPSTTATYTGGNYYVVSSGITWGTTTTSTSLLGTTWVSPHISYPWPPLRVAVVPTKADFIKEINKLHGKVLVVVDKLEKETFVVNLDILLRLIYRFGHADKLLCNDNDMSIKFRRARSQKEREQVMSLSDTQIGEKFEAIQNAVNP